MRQSSTAPDSTAPYKLGSFSAAPRALGSNSDVQCAGFIGSRDQPFDFSIIGSEYENLAPNLSAATGAGIVTQLTTGTLSDGTAGTDYGPYLRAMPANLTLGDTADGLAIDAACAVADAPCGWNLATADQAITAL